MPDLCKLMTSTFILFRSPSLLYQTANFLNWRLFKMNSAGALLLCKRLGRLSHIWLTGVDQRATPRHFRKKKETALGVMYGYKDVFLSTESTIEYIIEACTIGLIVKVSSFWLVYGWTIYIYNIKKNKTKWTWLFPHTGTFVLLLCETWCTNPVRRWFSETHYEWTTDWSPCVFLVEDEQLND